MPPERSCKVMTVLLTSPLHNYSISYIEQPHLVRIEEGFPTNRSENDSLRIVLNLVDKNYDREQSCCKNRLNTYKGQKAVNAEYFV